MGLPKSVTGDQLTPLNMPEERSLKALYRPIIHCSVILLVKIVMVFCCSSFI